METGVLTEKLLKVIAKKHLKDSTINIIQKKYQDYNLDNFPFYILKEYDLITTNKSELSSKKKNEIFNLVTTSLFELDNVD